MREALAAARKAVSIEPEYEWAWRAIKTWSEKLNQPNLRQLKQRIALRCVIKALPTVDETNRYITSRLLAAGARRTDIFSPDAIDYIYRCTEGIPRNINNICDNALLAGYAAGVGTIDHTIIEEVAENLDMLPRFENGAQPGHENELNAKIFNAAGRAELWSVGNGNGDHSSSNLTFIERHKEN